MLFPNGSLSLKTMREEPCWLMKVEDKLRVISLHLIKGIVQLLTKDFISARLEAFLHYQLSLFYNHKIWVTRKLSFLRMHKLLLTQQGFF